MAAGKAEVTVDRDPDTVWALVGDFDHLDRWMPGIDSCESDGNLRVLSTMGMELHEQLRERDDSARRISYSVVKSPMPLEHHLATITVTPSGDGSHVSWEYEVEPEAMVGAFAAAYEGSVQAIKAHLES